MSVYVPKTTEGGEWALPVDKTVYDKIHEWNAHPGAIGRASRLPWKRGWKPFEVKLLRKEGGRAFAESDCPWFTGQALVCRQKAVTAFEPLVGEDAEFLPLLCKDAELWLLRVWRTCDALDLERSDTVRFPSSGALMDIRRHEFRPNELAGHNFFRLSAMPRGRIYVQEAVVRAATAHNLRHVGFEAVWGAPVQSEVVEPWSWRNPPRSVSLEDIANAPDEKVWQLIFLCQVARVGGSALQQYEIVKAWSPGLRMLYATQVVDDEVSNGGFNQFFFNSSGQFAEEAVEGFQLIGASARADIVARAIQQFFKDAPALRPYHQQRTMEAFMESYSHTDLGTFDQAWYEAPEFFSARTAYIRAHPLEFVLPPAE